MSSLNNILAQDASAIDAASDAVLAGMRGTKGLAQQVAAGVDSMMKPAAKPASSFLDTDGAPQLLQKKVNTAFGADDAPTTDEGDAAGKNADEGDGAAAGDKADDASKP